jgi:hypothetical protein
MIRRIAEHTQFFQMVFDAVVVDLILCFGEEIIEEVLVQLFVWAFLGHHDMFEVTLCRFVAEYAEFLDESYIVQFGSDLGSLSHENLVISQGSLHLVLGQWTYRQGLVGIARC